MTEPATHIITLTDEQWALLHDGLEAIRTRIDDNIYDNNKHPGLYEDEDINAMNDRARDCQELSNELLVQTGSAYRWHDHFTAHEDAEGEVVRFDPKVGEPFSPEEERSTWTIIEEGDGLRALPGYHPNRNYMYYVMTAKEWTDADRDKRWLY